ncbi:helix-turn-helix transcriptional regulator [Kineococcus rubinsiae]|uniref:helix-turn-helix transcriptional regulator n=1 Tax=Kineococcus rubinsiae TaxID=2609562 RepID=UPI001430A143|nr:LuxR C-terminal-related transcriptional regulator [Kineococcus rubinsiae]NIZ89779.1 hypothetical protein [Kineococcus rubinsiae]
MSALPGRSGPRTGGPADDHDDAAAPPSFDALLEAAARDGVAVVETAAGRLVCLPEERYDALRGADGRGSLVTLTPREAEILGRVARGDAMVTVSTDLGVALNTVAQHLVAVRRKYGVRSTALAVEAARADGLI